MPRYLLSAWSVAGEPRAPMSPDEIQRVTEEVMTLERRLRSDGTLLLSGRLDEPRRARVARPTNGRVKATDGPFAETKEQLGGLYVVDVAGDDAALELASEVARIVGAPIEVRPFAEVP